MIVDMKINEINIMLDLHILRVQIVDAWHPRPQHFHKMLPARMLTGPQSPVYFSVAFPLSYYIPLVILLSSFSYAEFQL